MASLYGLLLGLPLWPPPLASLYGLPIWPPLWPPPLASPFARHATVSQVVVSCSTLDTLHKITISDNTFDHIRAIVPSKQGVWLAILGTTVLQLWDQQQLTRQLCVDIATNTCYKERQCQVSFVMSPFKALLSTMMC